MDGATQLTPAVLWRPLSPSQLPIWRAEVLHRGASRWMQMSVVRLNGPLQPERLARAVQQVVSRQPALRTRLRRRGGTVSQAFDPDAVIRLGRHERPTSADNPEALIQQFLDWGHRDPFKLFEEPLFRADLLAIGDETHVLMLRLHHIAGDGVALALIVSQLAEAYRDEGPGAEDVDGAYERWLDQQESGSPPGLQPARDYYRTELAGAVTHGVGIYDSPDDGSRREPPDLLEATRVLDRGACEALCRLGRTRSASLFVVLFSAFAATLNAIAGQEDLAVATFVSGRAAESEPIIGCCVNTVLVRVRLKGNDPEAAIEAVKEGWGRARRHRQVPISLVTDENGSPPPLVQFCINYLDMNEGPFQAPGLATSVTLAQQGFPLNDLLLFALRETDGRLRLRMIVGSGTPRVSAGRLEQILYDLAARLRAWTATPILARA